MFSVIWHWVCFCSIIYVSQRTSKRVKSAFDIEFWEMLAREIF